MPLHMVYSEAKKKSVERFYLHNFVMAQTFTEEDCNRVRLWRKQEASDARVVRACNIVLGWLGDEKQKYTTPDTWPVGLAEELDRAMWRAEGIV